MRWPSSVARRISPTADGTGTACSAVAELHRRRCASTMTVRLGPAGGGIPLLVSPVSKQPRRSRSGNGSADGCALCGSPAAGSAERTLASSVPAGTGRVPAQCPCRRRTSGRRSVRTPQVTGSGEAHRPSAVTDETTRSGVKTRVRRPARNPTAEFLGRPERFCAFVSIEHGLSSLRDPNAWRKLVPPSLPIVHVDVICAFPGMAPRVPSLSAEAVGEAVHRRRSHMWIFPRLRMDVGRATGFAEQVSGIDRGSTPLLATLCPLRSTFQALA